MPPRSPLPQRLGLDPAWLSTAAREGEPPREWASLRDWLHYRVGMHVDVDAFIAEGRFVTQSGDPVLAEDPFRPNRFIWFYRDLPDEAPVPPACQGWVSPPVHSKFASQGVEGSPV